MNRYTANSHSVLPPHLKFSFHPFRSTTEYEYGSAHAALTVTVGLGFLVPRPPHSSLPFPFCFYPSKILNDSVVLTLLVFRGHPVHILACRISFRLWDRQYDVAV